MKDYTLIDKSDFQKCFRCEGTGLGNIKEIECPTCNGTGLWKETHYIIIDEKNKIAFDSDTGS